MAEVQKRRHFAKEWLNHSLSETSKSTRNASLGVAAVIGVLTALVNWIRSWHSGHTLSPWGLIWPGLAVAALCVNLE
jgi:ABC-type enterobactin transport system permease subunit